MTASTKSNMIQNRTGTPSRAPRRGFTLVEVIIATVVAAFVLGALATSVGQLARARDSGKMRLDAHLRADAALTMIRRDVASIIRHEDLHWTRLSIRDGMYRVTTADEFDRDEILVFNTRLRSVHDLDFRGEGMQYETAYRIQDDEYGPILWQRLDPVPDENPEGGGIATPQVNGIIGLTFEAFDGYEWTRRWDSDEFGLPYAIRITVVASGHRNSDDVYEAPRAVLRTVVAIDRVLPPLEEIDEEEEIDPEELEDVSDPTAPSARDGDEDGGRGGRGGQTGDAAPESLAPGAGPGGRDPGGRGGRGSGGRGGGPAGRGGGAGGRGGGAGPTGNRPGISMMVPPSPEDLPRHGQPVASPRSAKA